MPGTRATRLRRLLADLRTAATMPRVTVVLSHGSDYEDAVLRRFRRRHPRYKLVASKAVGVALLPLEDYADVDGYLASLRTTRKRVRRAERAGYTFSVFDPDERRAELLEIHASLPERQGRPIDPEYLDPDAAPARGPDVDYVGVLHDGVVVAYGRLDYLGEVAGIGRVMGHGDHLDNGVMFLLTARIVGHVKATRPDVRYLLYDMFFGAPDGLRAFKTWLGFRPYYVRWTREPARQGGGS
jgi:hypothetical protein